MVKINIKVIGTQKVINMLKKLPKEIRTDVGDGGSKDIALSGQRRIVNRYNVAGYGKSSASTGRGLASLRRKLQFKKQGNNWIYSMDVEDYLVLIDRGVAGHYVSINVIEFHMSNPGATLGKTAAGLGLLPYEGKPFYWITKGAFITPGLKALARDVPKIIEKRIARVMANIKR